LNLWVNAYFLSLSLVLKLYIYRYIYFLYNNVKYHLRLCHLLLMLLHFFSFFNIFFSSIFSTFLFGLKSLWKSFLLQIYWERVFKELFVQMFAFVLFDLDSKDFVTIIKNDFFRFLFIFSLGLNFDLWINLNVENIRSIKENLSFSKLTNFSHFYSIYEKKNIFH
jgi:hypothetical protein